MFEIRPIDEQVEILCRAFPEIDFRDVPDRHRCLPPRMTGYLAIPPWQKIAKTYAEAIDRTCNAIGRASGGWVSKHLVWERDSLAGGRRYIYPSEAQGAVLAWQRLERFQPRCDILIVPARLDGKGDGISYSSRSWKGPEFPFGTYACGIVLLTHPKRLEALRKVRMSCPGDLNCPGAFNRTSLLPSRTYRISDRDLEFGAAMRDSMWVQFSLEGQAEVHLRPLQGGYEGRCAYPFGYSPLVPSEEQEAAHCTNWV